MRRPQAKEPPRESLQKGRGMSVPTPHEPAIGAQANGSRPRPVTVEHGALATAKARLDLAAASCCAARHDVNEDCHSALDGTAPVYVVADGVGGGAMASRASRELVAFVHRALDHGSLDDVAVAAALLDADREIARSIASHTSALGAATVALCACRETVLSRWLVAWVGDCRVYRIDTGGNAELLTRDDTYGQLLEPPPPGSSDDDPARMVGNGAVDRPNVAHVELGDDEMLVLCSDGVHKHVPAREIGRLIHRGPAPLARRCARLVVLARVRGSIDDATALVVHRRTSSGRRTLAWSGGALPIALAIFGVTTAALEPSPISIALEAAQAIVGW